MQQQQEGIKINITCNSSVDHHVDSSGTSTTSTSRPRRRTFKGNGWSGSKASRRAKRKKKLKPNFQFYAVFVGRSGEKIYETWAECKSNVWEFNGAEYKGFNHRIAAVDWLRGMRAKQAVKEMLQQQRPQEKSAAHATATHSTKQRDTADDIPTAIAVPIAIVTATAIPVRPPNPDPPERDFSPVAELARLIASYPNGDLSPPPVCSAKNCPYVCGEITHIQTALMQRLYQLLILTARHKY